MPTAVLGRLCFPRSCRKRALPASHKPQPPPLQLCCSTHLPCREKEEREGVELPATSSPKNNPISFPHLPCALTQGTLRSWRWLCPLCIAPLLQLHSPRRCSFPPGTVSFLYSLPVSHTHPLTSFSGWGWDFKHIRVHILP